MEKHGEGKTQEAHDLTQKSQSDDEIDREATWEAIHADRADRCLLSIPSRMHRHVAHPGPCQIQLRPATCAQCLEGAGKKQCA